MNRNYFMQSNSSTTSGAGQIMNTHSTAKLVGKFDVLSHRNASSSSQPRLYGYLIETNFREFRDNASNRERVKRHIVRSIVGQIHGTGGRFLRCDASSKQWFEMTNTEAKRKVARDLAQEGMKRNDDTNFILDPHANMSADEETLLHQILFRTDCFIDDVCNAIRANPVEALLPNDFGELPLSFIWRTFQTCFDAVRSRHDLERGGHLEKVWDLIKLLLQTSYHRMIDLPEGTKFRELHAVAGADCPIELVEFVLTVYPEQAYEQDEQGRYPLAIAAAAKPMTYFDEDLVEYDHKLSTRPPFGTTTFAAETEDYKSSKISLLLRANPDAARKPDRYDGRLPLTLAINSGKRWDRGVDCLSQYTPYAMVEEDEETRLRPFMSAAMFGQQSDLECIFRLLRASPNQCADQLRRYY